MRNIKHNVKIIKLTDKTETEKKKHCFRIRKYVDPYTKLVFDVHKSYAENKNAFYSAFRDVCAGKFKDIYEAHKAYV